MAPPAQLPNPSSDLPIYIFGIRHHGPGSARSLRAALEELRPDIILVEGPPDAAEVLPLLAHPQMQPPVALLIYTADDPGRAVYYPFANFSPEWQAIHYGLTNGIPVRFMDLPQAHQLGDNGRPTTDDGQPATDDGQPTTDSELPAPDSQLPSSDSELPAPDSDLPVPDPRHDPLGFLAEAAGYSDGERWWEHMVEHRRDGTDLFAAILEAMSAVRAETLAPTDADEARREDLREAFMRKTIRTAQKEEFQRIAVVCGAWHAPALADMPPAKADNALLKSLPKVKVQATWVPWTYNRLSYRSGYGAGIESPGWYHHLFTCASANNTPTDVSIRWMTHVARLLRAEGLDASSAHVIEAVRLAETLSALRDRPLPGLPEMSEAARAVFCFDSDLPMQLIHERLIVSDTLGVVPDDTPMVPLQQDLLQTQKRLRLAAEASWRDLDLDLRKPNDLARSHLLHRLGMLNVSWGQLLRTGGGKGTFHEYWRIEWQPELSVKLIEAGVWGNTIEAAATACARSVADQADNLPILTELINQTLLADLTEAIPHITHQLENQAAVTSDVVQMMNALPSLANVLRYGDVRRTDAGAVGHIVDGLVTRICIGVPGACASLNDDAAVEMFKHLVAVNDVIMLLQNDEQTRAWQTVLHHMADQQGLHGLLSGRCTRLLLDQRVFASDEVARRMGLALASANEPAYAAAWIEGLLKDSGTILIYDDDLWQVIDAWVAHLPDDVFPQILPLLRRTFATFQAPERRAIGERTRSSEVRKQSFGVSRDAEIDVARAEAVLPLVTKLLGLRAED